MNKKIGVSILIGVLVLIGFVGITKGVVYSEANANNMFNASMVLYGDTIEVDNTTLGGSAEIVNLTITHDGVSGLEITEINVSWSGNVTFNGFVSSADYIEDFGNESDPNNNVTILADGSVGSWACYNNSEGLNAQKINCHNITGASLSATAPTLIIRFNVTANSNIEDRNIWNITVTDFDPIAATCDTTANTTSLYTYVDGLAPRLFSLNISDGNMTYGNASGMIDATFNGTNVGGYATFLDANSDLTVKATFYELNFLFESMRLYYNLTDGGPYMATNNIDLDRNLYTNTITSNILSGSCVPGVLVRSETDQAWAHPIECSWTIPKSSTVSGWNETVVFGFDVNDTLNQKTTINDTYAGTTNIPFSILVNETLPHVAIINVTDGTYTRTTLDGTEYLNDQTTIVFEVSGAPRVAANETPLTGSSSGWVEIYYNTTGAVSIGTNGNIENYDNIITNITQIYNLTIDETVANLKSPTYLSRYSVLLPGAGNNSNTIGFAIVIGNTSMDNLNGNYTTIAGPYSWKVDILTEEPTITRVTQNSGVNQYDATGVEYKCTTTEGLSGVQKYVWTLVKPGTTDVVTESTSNTITFKESDLNVLGEYLVKCKVYDNVDNVNEKITSSGDSNTFTVSASTNVGSAGGAGGAGGTAAVVSFDIDFTTANEGSLKAQQGRVKSFSFDGVTKHTITFMEVTGTSATLKIESTPVTVTLNARDTKNVDVNGDGTNDVGVTLNSIVNGVADVTIKKIEEGAAKLIKEEESARGVTEEQQEVTPVEKGIASNTWVWILIAVIVIAALGYYFFNKKK